MINKFQQGGKQEDAIMLFVQGIAQELQADPQLVVQAAQQNPEALKAAVLVFLQTQDIKLAAQTFAQALQQKTQAARHGAKLNYIKSLKHQCAKDEEVYYFKKGGSVGCGCKKKEDGGEIKKVQKGTAVDKFKNRHIAEEDTIHTKKGIRDLSGKSGYPKFNPKEATNKEVIRASEKDYFAGRGDHSVAKEYPISERGKKPKTVKKENGGKTFKEKCGSKLKKHFNGGSLTLSLLEKKF